MAERDRLKNESKAKINGTEDDEEVKPRTKSEKATAAQEKKLFEKKKKQLAKTAQKKAVAEAKREAREAKKATKAAEKEKDKALKAAAKAKAGKRLLSWTPLRPKLEQVQSPGTPNLARRSLWRNVRQERIPTQLNRKRRRARGQRLRQSQVNMMGLLLPCPQTPLSLALQLKKDMMRNLKM